MLRRLPALVVLLLAFVPPLALGLWQSQGSLPAEPGIEAWADWSPWQQPGPGTKTLAQGATWLSGIRAADPPDWMTQADLATLDRAVAALEAGRATAGLGHLLVLADRMEAEGQPFADLVGLAAPEIAAFALAHFFAPVLLAALILVTALLLAAPMIAKGLMALARLIFGLAVGIVILLAAVWAGILLMGHPPLVYWAIEGLCWAAVVLAVGWIVLRLADRPQKKVVEPEPKPALKPPGPDAAPALSKPGAARPLNRPRPPAGRIKDSPPSARVDDSRAHKPRPGVDRRTSE